MLRGTLHGVIFLSAPLWIVQMLGRCETRACFAAASLSLGSKTCLFGASSAYHCGRWSFRQEKLAATVDLMSISFMISFSIAPAYLLLNTSGWEIVAISSFLACVASMLVMFRPNARLLLTAAFVAQGFCSLMPTAFMNLTRYEELMAVGCGGSYLVGASVYARRSPDPYPNTFGYHEIWHLLVVIGCASTYLLNMSVIERAQL